MELVEPLDQSLPQENPLLGKMIISPASAEGQELAKWEAQGAAARARKDHWPMMMYMARERPDGIVSVHEGDDGLFPDPKGTIQPGAAERWTARCQRVVHNEEEFRRALDEGWRETAQQALDRAKDRHRALMEAAAHREYEDRNMSPAAKAEAAEADAQTDDHLPEVPVKPTVKRARKSTAKGGARRKK